jgi:2-dehydro-3-deoxygluconokinase
MRRDGVVAGFGEVMIRLSAPRGERLLQTPRLDVTLGGAEANVLVSLARLGHATRMVTLLPTNELGRAAAGELARHGVNLSHVLWSAGRMGTYFLTPGAGARPAEVLYDRAGSVFATVGPEAIDWTTTLDGVGWLHLSGVTPAINAACAEAAIRAAQAARAAGATVSFDGNFRGSLWAAWDGDAPAILGRLFALADIAFADHRDVGLVLARGIAGADPAAAAAEAAFAAWSNLQLIAGTVRLAASADSQSLGARLFTRDRQIQAAARPLDGIVDRIGGGDAFAAGLIHGLRRGMGEQQALEFALAAAVLKHAVWGDFNLAREDEILALVAGQGADVRR